MSLTRFLTPESLLLMSLILKLKNSLLCSLKEKWGKEGSESTA